MKQMAIRTAAVLFALAVLVTPVSAGQAKGGITGDWLLKGEYDGMQVTSILSLSNDPQGNLKGEWISFLGIVEVSDLVYEDGNLSCVLTRRLGDRETEAKFTCTIRNGKLSGIFSSERSQRMEGTRLPRIPPAVGNWDMRLKTGTREFSGVLTIRADRTRKLTANWSDPGGHGEITNVKFAAGKLTFDERKSKIQSRAYDFTFEGTIRGQTLTGTFQSGQAEMADITAEGKRAGGAAIGQWELEIASDRGNRKQLLRINPDLTAMYGPLPIEKVDLDGNKVAFKISMQFGERSSEMSFAGQVEGNKMTGELTGSPRGTQTVTGAKRVQSPAKRKTVQVQLTLHEPDVIYVPTPQEVVEKMLELAQLKETDLVYDLGCGDGRIVVTAAKKYGSRAVGFDIARKRILESLKNVEKNKVGHLVEIQQKDIFTLDLSKADVVTLYLLPELNVKLIPQLEKLKPGSRIVSHDFDMEGVKPDQVVEVSTSDESWNEHTIYLWTTPLKKE